MKFVLAYQNAEAKVVKKFSYCTSHLFIQLKVKRSKDDHFEGFLQASFSSSGARGVMSLVRLTLREDLDIVTPIYLCRRLYMQEVFVRERMVLG